MPQDIFQQLEMIELNSSNFDEFVDPLRPGLLGVFFWGYQCPNCDVAKRSLMENFERVKGLGFVWAHVNVYENHDLGARFGLHGIPTFLFFKNGRKLGRISPFPGIEPFLEALGKLR